ncbi:MAG TPA: FCD domain-containing protein [Pseudonocardiaceae bacterium]
MSVDPDFGALHQKSSVDDALFRPVRAGNAFEETVERLLRAIKLGVVSVGERLPADVARRLSESLDDTLTVRYVVETGAAEVAARRTLTPGQRRHLAEMLVETSAADLVEYRRKDSRLHLAIAEVTGSASLTTALADVRMRINELLDEIPLLPPNLGHSNTQHEAIVAAILGGDPQAARQAMAEHLEGTSALLRAFLGP